MSHKDYYNTLGLDANANSDDIKTAYRKLARKYQTGVFQKTVAERTGVSRSSCNALIYNANLTKVILR